MRKNYLFLISILLFSIQNVFSKKPEIVFNPESYGGGTSVRYLKAKVFLSGPFKPTSSLMNDFYRQKNLIPLMEPYSTMGGRFLYTDIAGEVVTKEVLLANEDTPDAIVDWVFVELRDASAPQKIIKSRSALIQRDGDIVDVDGFSSVNLGVLSESSCYVSVKHRNHLGVMTAKPLAFENDTLTVNFSTLKKSDIYNNINRMDGSEMLYTTTANTLFAGDVNADGLLKIIGSGSDVDLLNKMADSNNNLDNPLIDIIIKDTSSMKLKNIDVNMDGVIRLFGSDNDPLSLFTTLLSSEANTLESVSFFLQEQIPYNSVIVKRIAPKEIFAIIQPKEGSQSYVEGNIKYQNLMRVVISETQDGVVMTDSSWANDFADPNENKKCVFMGNEPVSKAKDKKLENIALDGMMGFDIAPIVAYVKNDTSLVLGGFVQQFVHLPEKENRRHWEQDNAEYFFMPESYVYSQDSHLPQFWKTFPDYTLPANKYCMSEFLLGSQGENEALKKGYNSYGGRNVPIGNRMTTDYDRWLYNAGCPPFPATTKAINEWLTSVDQNVLLESFITNFYEVYKHYAIVSMDWEAVASSDYTIGGKLQACFDYWNTHPHKAKLSIWGRAAFDISRVNIEAFPKSNELTKDITSTGTVEDWSANYAKTSPFRYKPFYAENTEVYHCGGYMTYTGNYGWLEHLVCALIMNKKFHPEKIVIADFWNQMEVLGYMELGPSWFLLSDGTSLRKNLKPLVQPADMHNLAIWSLLVGDGYHLWEEPYERLDNPDCYGETTDLFYVDGKSVEKAKYCDGGEYASQSQQTIDRLEAGKWAVAMNKDIIEAKTPVNFVENSTDGGNTWNSGEEILPSKTLYSNKPMVAVKLSEDGKEAFVAAYWKSSATEKRTIHIRIGGKSYPIDVFGHYTSPVRLKL